MNRFTRTTAQATNTALACLLISIASLTGWPHAIQAADSIVLNEDFESYTNTESLLANWPGGSALLETAAPGGGKAALHDGGDLNSHGGFSVGPDAVYDVVFSADIYDHATNDQKRVTVALRNTSGANLEFGHINENASYSLRVIGFATSSTWSAFDAAQPPARGWHRYRAVISRTNTVVTLDLGADGTIDVTRTFAGPAPARPFIQIRFGGLPDRKSRGPVFIDNIKLALVAAGSPDTITMSGASATIPSAVTTAGAAAPAAVNLPLAVSVRPVEDRDSLGAAVWWIVGALAVIIVLLGCLLLMLRRAGTGSAIALIPATAAGQQQQQHLMREQVVQELTDFAKQGLVQGLYSQRNALIETQRKAQEALAELELRLAELNLPLQDRIQAYEKRIAELEAELESRGEEMRELTHATLLLVKQKLEEEKTLDRTRNRFN